MSSTEEYKLNAILRPMCRIEAVTRDEIREMVREELQRLVNFTTWVDGEKRRGRRGAGRQTIVTSVSIHPKLLARLEKLHGSISSHITMALRYYLIMMDLDY